MVSCLDITYICQHACNVDIFLFMLAPQEATTGKMDITFSHAFTGGS